MEELVNYINVIVHFGTAILSFVNCYAAAITAIATAITMWAIISQRCIANKARKDNLFKIRYEFYKNVVDFIRNDAAMVCTYYDSKIENPNQNISPELIN